MYKPSLVLIDPGHGGNDFGAFVGQLKEKQVNLIVAVMLMEILAKCGVGCAMTRGSDIFVSLDDRVDIEHQARPSCFVSIHCNNWSSENPRGFEIFTSPGETESDRLATLVHSEVGQFIPEMPWRSDLSDGDPDKEEKFRVLTGTMGPAVLMEMGFLSNPEDLDFISSRYNQYRIAHAMASGVLKWML